MFYFVFWKGLMVEPEEKSIPSNQYKRLKFKQTNTYINGITKFAQGS